MLTVELNLLVNESLPPSVTLPDTSLNARLLREVSFVHPVGAAVCWNNILEPDGILDENVADCTYLPSKSTVGFEAPFTVADNTPVLVSNDNAVR